MAISAGITTGPIRLSTESCTSCPRWPWELSRGAEPGALAHLLDLGMADRAGRPFGTLGVRDTENRLGLTSVQDGLGVSIPIDGLELCRGLQGDEGAAAALPRVLHERRQGRQRMERGQLIEDEPQTTIQPFRQRQQGRRDRIGPAAQQRLERWRASGIRRQPKPWPALIGRRFIQGLNIAVNGKVGASSSLRFQQPERLDVDAVVDLDTLGRSCWPP